MTRRIETIPTRSRSSPGCRPAWWAHSTIRPARQDSPEEGEGAGSVGHPRYRGGQRGQHRAHTSAYLPPASPGLTQMPRENALRNQRAATVVPARDGRAWREPGRGRTSATLRSAPPSSGRMVVPARPCPRGARTGRGLDTASRWALGLLDQRWGSHLLARRWGSHLLDQRWGSHLLDQRCVVLGQGCRHAADGFLQHLGRGREVEPGPTRAAVRVICRAR